MNIKIKLTGHGPPEVEREEKRRGRLFPAEKQSFDQCRATEEHEVSTGVGSHGVGGTWYYDTRHFFDCTQAS